MPVSERAIRFHNVIPRVALNCRHDSTSIGATIIHCRVTAAVPFNYRHRINGPVSLSPEAESTSRVLLASRVRRFSKEFSSALQRRFRDVDLTMSR